MLLVFLLVVESRLYCQSLAPICSEGNSTNPVRDNSTVLGEIEALSGPVDAATSRIAGTTSVLLDGTR
eukprot:jgi/Picsp_1/6717/NSC_04059-R1_---NA---